MERGAETKKKKPRRRGRATAMPDDSLIKRNKKQRRRSPPVHLPAHVVALILQRLGICEAVRLAAVCKTWAEAVHYCKLALLRAPLLVTCDSTERTCRLFGVTDGCKWFRVTFRRDHWFHLLGSGHGWLVMRRHDVRNVSLWNPLTNVEVDPPPLPNASRKVVLSSPPSGPGCAVLTVDSAVWLWKLGSNMSWSRAQGLDGVRLLEMAVVEDKFYALDDNGAMWVIDWGHPCKAFKLEVTNSAAIQRRHMVQKYLVESDGELLLALLINPNLRYPFLEAFKIVVFQLDRSCMQWVELKSLGDRVLFLSWNSTVSTSAADAGWDGNHIYFSYWENECYLFDMEDGSTKHSICFDPYICCGSEAWLVPKFA